MPMGKVGAPFSADVDAFINRSIAKEAFPAAEKEKEKRRRKIADMFLSDMENVNDEIVNSDLGCIEDFDAYARKTTQHEFLRYQYAAVKLIDDLHHNQTPPRYSLHSFFTFFLDDVDASC